MRKCYDFYRTTTNQNSQNGCNSCLNGKDELNSSTGQNPKDDINKHIFSHDKKELSQNNRQDNIERNESTIDTYEILSDETVYKSHIFTSNKISTNMDIDNHDNPLHNTLDNQSDNQDVFSNNISNNLPDTVINKQNILKNSNYDKKNILFIEKTENRSRYINLKSYTPSINISKTQSDKKFSNHCSYESFTKYNFAQGALSLSNKVQEFKQTNPTYDSIGSISLKKKGFFKTEKIENKNMGSRKSSTKPLNTNRTDNYEEISSPNIDISSLYNDLDYDLLEKKLFKILCPEFSDDLEKDELRKSTLNQKDSSNDIHNLDYIENNIIDTYNIEEKKHKYRNDTNNIYKQTTNFQTINNTPKFSFEFLNKIDLSITDQLHSDTSLYNSDVDIPYIEPLPYFNNEINSNNKVYNSTDNICSEEDKPYCKDKKNSSNIADDTKYNKSNHGQDEFDWSDIYFHNDAEKRFNAWILNEQSMCFASDDIDDVIPDGALLIKTTRDEIIRTINSLLRLTDCWGMNDFSVTLSTDSIPPSSALDQLVSDCFLFFHSIKKLAPLNLQSVLSGVSTTLSLWRYSVTTSVLLFAMIWEASPALTAEDQQDNPSGLALNFGSLINIVLTLLQPYMSHVSLRTHSILISRALWQVRFDVPRNYLQIPQKVTPAVNNTYCSKWFILPPALLPKHIINYNTNPHSFLFGSAEDTWPAVVAPLTIGTRVSPDNEFASSIWSLLHHFHHIIQRKNQYEIGTITRDTLVSETNISPATSNQKPISPLSDFPPLLSIARSTEAPIAIPEKSKRGRFRLHGRQ